MMAGKSSRDWICISCQRIHVRRRVGIGQERAFSQHALRSQAIRPPNAPQQTPPISHIRRNWRAYEENCLRRRYLDRAEEARTFDKEYDHVQELRRQIQEPRRQLKAVEKKIGALQARRNEDTDTVAEIDSLKKEAQSLKEGADISAKEQILAKAEQRLHDIALGQPSLTSPQTPFNNSEVGGKITSEPVLIEYLNYDPTSPAAKALKSQHRPAHTDIGSSLSLLDFASASTTTGWGWYYLCSQAALLEQALIQYALSVLVKRGWTIVSPPSLVYSYIAEACGFQPRDQNDEQQIYELAQSARDVESGKPPRSLAGTAEIPLAAMLANQTISASNLPVKVAGVSRCYRAEAGARGVESKGLYRVHEFNKVEMFAWTDSPQLTTKDSKKKTSPDSSTSPPDPLTNPSEWTKHSTPIFDEMLNIQKEILASLDFPCRVLEMPITDLGASAWRKIDIEAFFPSRYRRGKEDESDPDNGWGELTSTSICTDYQSRRLGTRVKDDSGSTAAATTTAAAAGGGSTRFAHTVNGTAMAVPRVLAALMEYGYRADEKGDGRIEVPEVLRKWMPGGSS